jgi:FkbH-like protein
VLLACGLNPLHLQTFLQAHLQILLPSRPVQVSTGLYGDLMGTLSGMTSSSEDMVAVAIEWPDLDSRLGFRHAGGWGPRELGDILTTVQTKLHAFREILATVPRQVQLALSLPTLPLPPIFPTPSWQLSLPEQRLLQALDEFARWAGGRAGLRIVNPRYLWQVSNPTERFDFKSELLTGISYTRPHADQLAACLAQLLVPRPSKKGLITDLDGTLWSGIAGEDGVQALSWSLENQAQSHGLYQQLLRALAEQGVLLAVASKNSPEVVEQAFQRSDILLPRKYVFPVEAKWGPKSESIARILRAWNVGPESLVFVDDNRSELAEVEIAFPNMECILFPAKDYSAVQGLLYRLRDVFAKENIFEEDSLRRESLRTAHALDDQAHRPPGTYEDFMRDAGAEITFDWISAAASPRSLELVNKTNQFNLNGLRYTESDWQKALQLPNAFVVTASYQDKYGPLGVIAVICGEVRTEAISIDTWVMSCRAFGRRIEHHCLLALFQNFATDEIFLEFAPTPRNQPIEDFFSSMLGAKPTGPFKICQSQFESKKPMLYHKVRNQV